jgi:hypothetical protein
MKTFKTLLIAIVILAFYSVNAQVVVTTDGSSADGSAMLEVKSDDKGFLPPRMTENQRDGISDPATGLIIYQTNGTAGLYEYNGTAWVPVKGTADGSETMVTAGDNVTITGTGTTASPYVVNAVPNHYVGELYGGGVVFWVDHTGQHGLIVSMIDLGNTPWSNVSNVFIGTTNDWNGAGNTTAITGQSGHISSAAKLCVDYTNIDYGTGTYSDWYLPSRAELNHVWNNLYEVQKALSSVAGSDKMEILYYWSSTERSNVEAWIFFFVDGTAYHYPKSNSYFVRAVRAF